MELLMNGGSRGVEIHLREEEGMQHTRDRERARRNPGNGHRRGSVRQRLWRLAAVSLSFLLCAASAGRTAEQGNGSSEYQVKAAFLFHFAQFVEWPAEVFKDSESPVTYCTAGGDPFEGGLEASLNGKMIAGRTVRVVHLKEVGESQGCQILFLGIGDKKVVSATLGRLNGRPVLTVGESERFAQDGGMIGFVLEDNKVRFEINVGAAEQAKLKISARLLALAKRVIGSPKGT
jgi:YfiR/HmsC-like